MSEVPIAAPRVGDAELDRIQAVLEDGQLADGPVVRGFEAAFADYCGVDHGVATANGTAALHAALRAVGVDEGDAVVTTPFSFVATANAIRFCGAEPVFADVDPETYNLDPAAVERVLADRDDVAAMVAVHLYGLPADVGALREVADAHDLALVEDAAQSHGATYRGDRVGSFGDAAAFSFYPTKNMTTGEGGMVVTDRGDVADRAARFVDHGRAEVGGGYRHVELGHNFRLSSVAAAIGAAQLEKLPEFTEARRENAAALTEGLADVGAVTTPVEPDDRRHVYNQYTVRVPDRTALRESLAEAGIGTGVYYPQPIPDQPAYDGVDPWTPIADRVAAEVASLPVHPGVTAADRDRIVAAVGRHYGDD